MDNDENEWGSDNDDVYYDADDEKQRNNAYMNNHVAGTFSRWKCKSMLPLDEF